MILVLLSSTANFPSRFKSQTSHGLGKKGHKFGIMLQIAISKHSQEGIDLGKLEDMFSKVGKDLHLGWTVEARVV